jgi:response regulator of citrate/malate metabolism
MPGIDGFEVLRRLSGSDMPIVIFVTAYDEFALNTFDANALDYLLKPINDERLGEAIERARQARDEKLASRHRAKLLNLVCELPSRELTLEGAIESIPSNSPPTIASIIAPRACSSTPCAAARAIGQVSPRSEGARYSNPTGSGAEAGAEPPPPPPQAGVTMIRQ